MRGRKNTCQEGRKHKTSNDEHRSDNSVTYTVRKGDNIWNIANSFGIRADLIYRWNGIDRGSFIFPGDKLVIYLKK